MSLKGHSEDARKYVRGQVHVRLIIADLDWDTFTSIRVGFLRKEGIPVFERVAHESTYCAEVGVADFVAEDELGTISDMVRSNSRSLLTRRDSDNVRTSSFDRYPSLSLSCKLKNHSMLSIKSLNMIPSNPETTSLYNSA